MLTLIRRLASLTIFTFLCTLVYSNLAIAHSNSSSNESLKGTGSTGSFSYEEEQKTKDSAIGYGAHKQKNEGSKTKSYSHRSSGHIPGSHTQKKPEDSQSKSYSHGKYGHEKSKHGSMGGYGKSYGHKKGSHGGHGQSPFKHVMHYKNKLGLTDAQIQTMKELDADFKKKIIQAMADHKIAHVDLDLQVHSGKVDEARIRAVGAKIVASKTNKIMAMIDAKIQLLNLMTAEQRLKMAKMH